MVPTNDFLPFCATDTGSNLLTQGDYVADAQRPIGNQPGVARSKLVNKAARQAAWIAAQFAQFISNRTGDDVLDDQNSTNILATMAKAFLIPSNSFYQGYHDPNGWTTTSSSYADFTPSGSGVLTQRQASNLTVTTAAGNLPGITFTPASATAVYQIIANVTLSISNVLGNNAAGSLRLYDGTTEIVRSPDMYKDSHIPQLMTGAPMSGIYIPGTTSPVTVKVQGLVGGDPGFLMQIGYVSSAVEWTVIRIK